MDNETRIDDVRIQDTDFQATERRAVFYSFYTGPTITRQIAHMVGYLPHTLSPFVGSESVYILTQLSYEDLRRAMDAHPTLCQFVRDVRKCPNQQLHQAL